MIYFVGFRVVVVGLGFGVVVVGFGVIVVGFGVVVVSFLRCLQKKDDVHSDLLSCMQYYLTFLVVNF
jgi:hypothetical protein